MGQQQIRGSNFEALLELLAVGEPALTVSPGKGFPWSLCTRLTRILEEKGIAGTERERESLGGRCAALPHTQLNCTLQAPGEGLCRTISGSGGRETLPFPSNPHQSSRDSSL